MARSQGNWSGRLGVRLAPAIEWLERGGAF
jgi:predicted oxidoreductase